MNRQFHVPIIISILAFSLSFCGEVLNVSSSTLSSLQQKGAQLHNDATVVSEPVQCIDLGLNGNVEIPVVVIPKGPFSIESKFYLRNYNPIDPMISDIVSAFNCDYGNTGARRTEGIDFRIGGGYLYPLKIQDTYNNVSDWVHPTEEQKLVRQAISNAVGEFALGSGSIVWKEIYTNRCIERETWTHMVAIWDGVAMQIFLNGHNATDTWRILGKDLPAFIRDTSRIVIGAENITSSRHFNGNVGFVKIYNTALSSEDIFKKYRESLDNDRCVKFIKIESPRCGEVISSKTKLKFSIETDFSCDTTVEHLSYSVDICHEKSFFDTSSVRKYSLASTDCTFSDIVGKDSCDFNGLFFIRITGRNNNGLKKSSVVEEPVAMSGTVPAYVVSATVKNIPRTTKKEPVTFGQEITHNRIFDCRGRMVINFGKMVGSQMKSGVYFARSDKKTDARVLYMK